MRRISWAIWLAGFLAFSLSAKEQVNISGYILAHYEQYLNEEGKYQVEETGGDYQLEGRGGYGAFQITRAYFTVKADLSDKLKVRLTSDVYTDEDGLSRVFLKYAYVEIRRVIPAHKIRFGLQSPPWGGYIEQNYWGYRLVDQAFFDYWKFFSTADFGVGILGELWEGKINYQLAVLNGEGYKKIEQDQFKEYVGRISLDLGKPDKFRIIPSLGYSSHRWNDSDKFKDEVLMAGLGMDFWRIHLAGEYLQGVYTLPAGEYPMIGGRFPEGAVSALEASSPDKLLNENKDIDYGGWAVYFNLSLPYQLNVFGRYDFYDPNLDSDYDNDAQEMWMAGICWHPHPSLWLTLDYRQMNFQELDLDGDGIDELEPEQIIYTHWKIAY